MGWTVEGALLEGRLLVPPAQDGRGGRRVPRGKLELVFILSEYKCQVHVKKMRAVSFPAGAVEAKEG